MKKKLFFIMLVTFTVCFAGCAKEKPGRNNKIEEIVNQEGVPSDSETPTQEASKPVKFPNPARLFQVGDKIVSEDYKPGNNTIQKTDTGYYYYSRAGRGLRYVDEATGGDMFLCNKPECRHDGNAFCVATNKKLSIRNFCLYGGNLFAAVAEETDTQFAYKLFSIALDGSETNEIATFYQFEKGGKKVRYSEDMELVIHRNKVIFPFSLGSAEGFEDTIYYGTAIYDFDTKKVSYLDAEPVSKENPERTSVCVHGDYVYYCVKQDKKTVLCRYHLTEGTEESYNLLPQFMGQYVVADDDTIVYIKSSGRAICVHHRENDWNEEKVQIGGLAGCESLITDGTYIYAAEDDITITSNASETGAKSEQTYLNLHVFTLDLEHVQTVNLAEKVLGIQWEDVPVPLNGEPRNYSYVGEDVYCVFMEKYNTANKNIFKCKRSDLLAGRPQFEFVYKDVPAPYFGER